MLYLDSHQKSIPLEYPAVNDPVTVVFNRFKAVFLAAFEDEGKRRIAIRIMMIILNQKRCAESINYYMLGALAYDD